MRDVHTVIVGGGASGMCAAILLKRKLINEEIVILESLDRVGKKLIVTGNGRCNISNRYIEPASYHGEDVSFCKEALNSYGVSFTESFFESIGVPFCEGENGKLYPYSLQASSVVDALRFELEKLNVQVLTKCSARSISPQNNGFQVVSDLETFACKNLIMATGGIAGGAKLGSFGMGYTMLEHLGFKLVPLASSLVQLKTELLPIKSLNGIKQNSTVTLYTNGKKYRSETGELLFTRYGISGPPVLQISRNIHPNSDYKVKINFMPEYDYSDILDIILKRRALLKERTADNFFTGLFPKMLGHTILKVCEIKLSGNVGDFTEKQCRMLAEQIYSFTLKVISDNGIENAQVTCGGISTKDFCDKTMESKKYKGLYVIGELLDIDGDCGGFNLQWAWSGAAAAAAHIVGKSK